MTPRRCRICGQAPVWFALGDGRGRYQCQHPGGDWSATAGPIPEPEARVQWDTVFGAAP